MVLAQMKHARAEAVELDSLALSMAMLQFSLCAVNGRCKGKVSSHYICCFL